MAFKLSSSAFSPGGEIPSKYTCQELLHLPGHAYF